jgi:hypothetical protein
VSSSRSSRGSNQGGSEGAKTSSTVGWERPTVAAMPWSSELIKVRWDLE